MMHKRNMRPLIALGLLLGSVATGIASTNSTIQSPLRPLGLPITAKVQKLGSDAAALSFETIKVGFQNTCKSKLPEGNVFTGASLNQLDPQRLYFLFDYAPRVYFLNEGACYTNALGATIATVTTPTNAVLTGTTFTIFPNTHSALGTTCTTNSGVRSTSEPLLPGDFVQLPLIKSGQQLAFFLMANMDSSGNPQYTAYNGSGNNPDGYQHLIAFFPDNSQYVIIGFEDMLNGGDKDCNDVLFVVDIGPLNAALLRDPSTLPK